VFTKSHSEGLAVTSFGSLCLRTHPHLTFIMLSKCNMFFLRFFLKSFWQAKRTTVKKCVSYGRYVLHELLFQPIRMWKTFDVIPLTCPTRINLTQTNNFTVKSVKGVFYSFDSLIACRCNCCFQTICKSACWQLKCTALTLSQLFKNNWTQRSQVWKLMKLYALATNGLCIKVPFASPCSS